MHEPNAEWENRLQDLIPGIHETERASFALLTASLPESARNAVGRPALNPDLYVNEPWRRAVEEISDRLAAGQDLTEEALLATDQFLDPTITATMNLLRGPDVTDAARAEVVAQAERLAENHLRRTWFYESSINTSNSYRDTTMIPWTGEPTDTFISYRLRESAAGLADAGQVLAQAEWPPEWLPDYQRLDLEPTPPAFDLRPAGKDSYVDVFEESFINWCRQDPDGLRAAAGWLRAEDFSSARAQGLWREAMADLDRGSLPVSANPTRTLSGGPADDATKIAFAAAKRHYDAVVTELQQAAHSPYPTEATDTSALFSKNEKLVESLVVAHDTLERLLCSSAAREALAVLGTPVENRRAGRAVPRVGQLVNPTVSASDRSGKPAAGDGIQPAVTSRASDDRFLPRQAR